MKTMQAGASLALPDPLDLLDVRVLLLGVAVGEELRPVEVARGGGQLGVGRLAGVLLLEQRVGLRHALGVCRGVVDPVPEGHVDARVVGRVVLLPPLVHELFVIVDALQLVDADLPGRRVRVRAVEGARGLDVAVAAASRLVRLAIQALLRVRLLRAGARQAEPRAAVVDLPSRERKARGQVVAADKVAILLKLVIAHPRAGALAAVEGVADAEVHPRLVQGLRCPGLELPPRDAADAKPPHL
mmetsp:Transcript_38088/g.115135  ORF Transcript_38088/g.115135 Transcript_38088/m.115135 type:complete len:243 (+) Transcript_38088:166-894(+)